MFNECHFYHAFNVNRQKVKLIENAIGSKHIVENALEYYINNYNDEQAEIYATSQQIGPGDYKIKTNNPIISKTLSSSHILQEIIKFLKLKDIMRLSAVNAYLLYILHKKQLYKNTTLYLKRRKTMNNYANVLEIKKKIKFYINLNKRFHMKIKHQIDIECNLQPKHEHLYVPDFVNTIIMMRDHNIQFTIKWYNMINSTNCWFLWRINNIKLKDEIFALKITNTILHDSKYVHNTKKK